MGGITRQFLGQWGEQQARDYYQRRGYRIVAVNFYNHKGKRFGEIDFVAWRGKVVVFVEVKTRTRVSSHYGLAAEAITSYKQARLLRIIKLFLLQKPQFAAFRPQIDICLIEVKNLDNRDFSVTILANAVTDDFR